jgi:hypothetical protein
MMLVGLARTVTTCVNEFDRCDSDDDGGELIVAGLIGYVVLHIWEIADAIGAPSSHNARLRELRARTGYAPVGTYGRVMPYVAPAKHDGGGVAGVSFSF